LRVATSVVAIDRARIAASGGRFGHEVFELGTRGYEAFVGFAASGRRARVAISYSP